MVNHVTVTKMQTARPKSRGGKITYTWHNLFMFLRRVAIIAMVVLYIVASVESSIASLKVLRGTPNEPMKFEAYSTTNLIKYMGEGAVNQSPLVLQLLKNDTSTRNYTLFIEENSVSPSGCATPLFNKAVYSNLFIRLGMLSLTRDTYFNYTDLVAFQLVLPIVDCSFLPLTKGSNTIMRMYYLMRLKSNPSLVGLFAVRFNMQNYRIDGQNEAGPVGLTTYL